MVLVYGSTEEFLHEQLLPTYVRDRHGRSTLWRSRQSCPSPLFPLYGSSWSGTLYTGPGINAFEV